MTPRLIYRDFAKESANGYCDDSAFCFETWATFWDQIDNQRRPPGVSRGPVIDFHGYESEVLLYCDAKGVVVGFHVYCVRRIDETAPGHMFPGYTLTLVDPNRRRQGIGTALLLESIRHFGLDLDEQDYTREGWALAKRVREILRTKPAWNAHLMLKECSQRVQDTLGLIGMTPKP